MRYRSVFSVCFNATSDADARSIARQHYQLIRDDLRVEGADTPYDITLEHIYDDSREDLLREPAEKSIQ